MTTEFYFDPEVQTMFVCSMCSNVITCVTKNGANNHDNEHGKDEHEVGAKHTLALLMMVMTNTIKEETKNLYRPKAAEEGNYGDDGGNDDDDVGGRRIKADVKLAFQVRQSLLSLKMVKFCFK